MHNAPSGVLLGCRGASKQSGCGARSEPLLASEQNSEWNPPWLEKSNLMRAVNRQPGFRPGTRRVFHRKTKTPISVRKTSWDHKELISKQKREISRKVDTCHFLWERKKSPSVQLQKRQSYQSAAFKMVYPGRAVLFQTNGWILRNLWRAVNRQPGFRAGGQ